jgi:HSP20 family molecular chaperone IbpA
MPIPSMRFLPSSVPLKTAFPAIGLAQARPPEAPTHQSNVFQQGDDLVAIVEMPGVNKEDLNIRARKTQSASLGRRRSITQSL